MNKAELLYQILEVVDPKTNEPVLLNVYKHEKTGKIFAVDADYLDETTDCDNYPIINDPYTSPIDSISNKLMLINNI